MFTLWKCCGEFLFFLYSPTIVFPWHNKPERPERGTNLILREIVEWCTSWKKFSVAVAVVLRRHKASGCTSLSLKHLHASSRSLIGFTCSCKLCVLRSEVRTMKCSSLVTKSVYMVQYGYLKCPLWQLVMLQHCCISPKGLMSVFRHVLMNPITQISHDTIRPTPSVLI